MGARGTTVLGGVAPGTSAPPRHVVAAGVRLMSGRVCQSGVKGHTVQRGDVEHAGLSVSVASDLRLRREVSGTRDVRLGSRQLAVVAVCFIVWRDHAVPPSRLAEQVWRDPLPQNWRGSLRVLVSRLRGALSELGIEGEPIPFKAGAYRFAVEPVHVDIEEAIATLGRAETAFRQGDLRSARADAAVARAVLSRPVLPGFEAPVVDGLRHEVESANLGALRLTAACRCAMGEHAGAVSAARQAIELDPLRESSWRQLMDVHRDAGETGAALRAYEQCRRRLADELGTDPSPRTRALHDRLLGPGSDEHHTPAVLGDEPAVAVVGPERLPYRGLLAFGVGDADLFFGRDAQVQELVDRLDRRGVVAVTGPSGSGKTSLVRAGLIPALAKGVLPESDLWPVRVMVPGRTPASTLLHALRPSSGAGRTARAAAGAMGDGLTAQLLSQAVAVLLDAEGPGQNQRLVLVVDQAEELFTAVEDVERTGFIDGVLGARRCLVDRLLVVLVLRSDFLGRAAELPGLADILSTSQYVLGPMSGAGLEAAVTEPARRVGVTLERGLVGRILGDVLGRPGALPLVQYAMLELWRRRDGDRLTMAAYHEMGGVQGALRSRADAVFNELDAHVQDAARHVLLRLVEPGADTADVRRRAAMVELRAVGPGGGVDVVLDRFVEARLVTVSARPGTSEPTVEIAHEALLREWPRMRDWIEERREALVELRQLRQAAADWERSNRDEAFLLRGTRLARAEGVLRQLDLTPSEQESTYLRHSVLLRRIEAESAAAIAEAQRRSAVATRARQLALEARAALAEDPERAIMLATEAVERTRRLGEPALPEAIGILEESTQRSRVLRRLDAGRRLATASPDGRYVAADTELDSPDPVVFDLANGDRHDLDGPDGFVPWGASPGVWELAFSPDGLLLAAGYQHRVVRHGYGMVPDPDGPMSPPPVVLFDPRSGGEVRRLAANPGCYFSLDFDDSGRWLAGSDLRGSVTVWDVATGRQVAYVNLDAFANQVHFLPRSDGVMVIESQQPDGIWMVDRGGDVLDFLPTVGLGRTNVSISPAGDRLALTSLQGRCLTVHRLDPWHCELVHRVTGPLASAWSPDGSEVAVSGNRGVITLLDAASGRPRLDLPGSMSVRNLQFMEEDRLLSPTWDGQALIWDVSPTGPHDLGAIRTTTGPQDGFAVAGCPPYLGATTRPPGAFELLDLDESGATTETLLLAESTVGDQFDSQAAVADDDLTHVASMRADGMATLRTLPGLDLVAELPRDCQPRAVSRGGALVHVNRLHGRHYASDTNRAVGWVLDPATGQRVIALSRYAFDAHFLPNGAGGSPQHLVICDLDHGVFIHDLDSGGCVAALTRQDLGIVTYPLSLAHDGLGRFLAGGSQDGRVWAADLPAMLAGAPAEETIIFSRLAHTGPAPRPAVRADGLLATIGHDSAVRVWDLEGDRLVSEFSTRLTDQTPAVAFTPDGRALLYPDAEDVIRRHLLDPDELVARSRRRLTRTPTAAEQARITDESTQADT